MNSAPSSFSSPPRAWIWFAISVIAAASMAHYVWAVWSYNQPPGFSDLYAPWWAAHELFLHGRNPYSTEVAHEIQRVIYGAPSLPSADDPAGIGGGFAYPPYATLLLWPTAYVSFAAAQKIFVVAALLLTLLSLELWLRAARFRPPPLEWWTIAFFVLGSFPALQALKLENLSLIAAAMLAAAVYFISAEQWVAGGVLLAIATFKPQFTIALIPWLAIWTITDWRRRRALAFSFLAAMAALLLASSWLVPGWVSSFVSVLRAYRHYTFGHSLFDVWLTARYGFVASLTVLLSVWGLCWRDRGRPDRFFAVVSLLLAVDVVVIPSLAPHAQLLLVPGFLYLAQNGTSRPRTLAWALLGWSWIAAAGMLVARVGMPVADLARYWQWPLYTSPLLALAVAVAVGVRLEQSRVVSSGSSPV